MKKQQEKKLFCPSFPQNARTLNTAYDKRVSTHRCPPYTRHTGRMTACHSPLFRKNKHVHSGKGKRKNKEKLAMESRTLKIRERPRRSVSNPWSEEARQSHTSSLRSSSGHAAGRRMFCGKVVLGFSRVSPKCLQFLRRWYPSSSAELRFGSSSPSRYGIPQETQEKTFLRCLDPRLHPPPKFSSNRLRHSQAWWGRVCPVNESTAVRLMMTPPSKVGGGGGKGR